MTARIVAGITSIVAGSLGLIAVIAARYGESLRGAWSAYLLPLAVKIGFVHDPPPGGVDEVKAAGLLSLTDESALQAVFGYGMYLGLLALLMATLAALDGEDSLYLGTGFTCGWLALVVANFYVGMLALIVGAALILAAQRKSRARSNPPAAQ